MMYTDGLWLCAVTYDDVLGLWAMLLTQSVCVYYAKSSSTCIWCTPSPQQLAQSLAMLHTDWLWLCSDLWWWTVVVGYAVYWWTVVVCSDLWWCTGVVGYAVNAKCLRILCQIIFNLHMMYTISSKASAVSGYAAYGLTVVVQWLMMMNCGCGLCCILMDCGWVMLYTETVTVVVCSDLWCRAQNGDWLQSLMQPKWFNWWPEVFKQSPNWRLVQN